MPDIALRHLHSDDYDAVVALNASEIQHTSAMDRAQLQRIDALSTHHRVATVDGQLAGVLLAMREGCGYANDNFAWFSARYDRFLYVDRIVIARDHQAMALGRRLYEMLFEIGRAEGIATICCEYNLAPPNEPSRAFHARFGFREVGRRETADGRRILSLQVAQT